MSALLGAVLVLLDRLHRRPGCHCWLCWVIKWLEQKVRYGGEG